MELPSDLVILAQRPECAWISKEFNRLTKGPGIWYDQSAADAAVRFFPDYLRLTDGEWAGKPFILSPWQEAINRIAFGLKRADGFRQIRRVLLWVPRKNGKTELLAGVSLLALMADAEYGGQCYSIAASEDQARIVFDKAATMIAMSEHLPDHLVKTKESIYSHELHAALKPLSGNPHGKHGLSASFIGGDEMHEWPSDRLYTFLHQSSGARRQPLEFLISTAGIRGWGYGWQLWEESCRIRDGLMDDDETLVVIYAADKDDDWNDEAVWIKANPNIGTSPKWSYLRSEYKKAKESPRRENDFKRYHLNQWTEQAVRWLPLDTWDQGASGETWNDIDDLKGRACYAGLDLSSTGDITAFVLAFPPKQADAPWRILPRFWVPADNIETRSRRDRVPYDDWRRIGAIEATEGNVVDYEALLAAIFDAFATYDIKVLAVDPFNATATVQRIQQEIGEERIKMMRQGYLSISAPTKELERLVLSRRIDHGKHPVLRWMAGNVAITQDPAGNIKPAKDKSTEKIDGIAALINALGASMVPGVQSSYLEKTDLVIA
jgi:phage terminase large subunit-like protein